MTDPDPNTPDIGSMWSSWFATDAFHVDKQLRSLNRHLPSEPRCKFCAAPFHGLGGFLERAIFHKAQSTLNPRFCNMCDMAMRQFPGGAEVPMAMLFVDIRNSTELSSKMSPMDFSRLINRFYSIGSKLVSGEDGLVEKLAGDAIAAFWGAGFAGPDYVRRTVHAGQRMSMMMRKDGIPVGVGVHAGIAFFGAVGQADGLTNVTAAGEQVNLAARLAAEAAEGEVIVSEQALKQAAVPFVDLESRLLNLKGIADAVPVRVMHGV